MSNKASYIAFDTETAGLDANKNPVLTAYFAALDENLKVMGELDIKILPEAPYDAIEPEAMEVNKIDLEKHNQVAMSRAEAKDKIVEFIKKYGSTARGSRPKMLGQNIGFDKEMINTQLVDRKTWETYVHYHSADTVPISLFLKECGWLPPEVGSLESMVKYLGITKLSHHEARSDVLMTIEVYKKLKGIVAAAKNNTGQDHSDLLALLE
jgi:oligoribonuclease (3'-5' exoribonuclease)